MWNDERWLDFKVYGLRFMDMDNESRWLANYQARNNGLLNMGTSRIGPK